MVSLMRPSYIFDAHALKHAIKVRGVREVIHCLLLFCCFLGMNFCLVRGALTEVAFFVRLF